ncbi:MAG TPA: hypothetical protein VML96_08620 [Egibacteraceae bacterium]|nr:hypothetical protein [Egibacteraceae bacterium]
MHADGGVVGRPQADVIWTGYGNLATSRWTYRYSDGTTTETFTESSRIRSATMSGNIGPMGFDPELSGGSITSFKSSSKSRTK